MAIQDTREKKESRKESCWKRSQKILLLLGIFFTFYPAWTVMPASTPTNMPVSSTCIIVAEGTLARVEVSFCMAGETHVLLESYVYLYSDYIFLDAYVDRYVRVWGYSVPSPECMLMNVTAIIPLERVHLPLIVRNR